METVTKYTSKFISVNSYAIRFILNVIENGHNKLYQLLKTLNLIPPKYINSINDFENQLKTYSPFSLIAFSLILILLYYLIIALFITIKNIFDFFANFKENLYNLYFKLPGSKAKLAGTKMKIKEEFTKTFNSNKYKKIEFHDNKQDYTKVLAKMEQNVSNDNTKSSCGKLTGTVYCDSDQIKYIGGEAAKMFLYSNLLHTDIYSYNRYIESELIKIGVDLFNGGNDACGMTTNGGTMSIINAIYAYYIRGKNMGIKEPELIIPISAHAAFEKTCQMFSIKCIKIPLNKKDYKVNLKLVERNITKNTICIVGSFPNFPHGISDDIESLSKLALKYKKPLHVDCCLGGFLVAFHERAGILNTPLFDFRLPGVTSISCDLHKYGLCPKGISLLLFSNHEYRKNIFFSFPRWMGGVYITPSFEGSRTGSLIASSYAILTSMGKEFYANNAKLIYNAVNKVKEFARKECDLLEVIGDPFICGVSFTSKYVANFYDLLSEKGYHINFLNEPAAFGYIFTSANVQNVDQYIKDLKEINDRIKKEKPNKISYTAKLYGMSFSLPESIARNTLDVIGDAFLD